MRRTAKQTKKCADFLFVRNHVNRTKKECRTPFHRIINSPYHDINGWHCDLGLCRMMAEEGAIDILIDDPSILKTFRGSLEMLRFMHQQALPAYTLNSQYTAQEHIAIAAGMALGWSSDICSALNVEYWMGGNSDTKGEMVDWVNSEGSNFLHCLARGFGQFSWATNYREMNSQIEHDAARAWHRLICRSISAGCSIFSVNHSGKTILSTVIDEYLTFYLYGNRPLWDIQLVLREWLDDLAGCGIDLLAYGDAEKAHWHPGNWGYECSCPQRPVNGDAVLCNTQHVSYHHYPKRWNCHDDYPKKGITVRFVYGPRPEDWIFFVEERDEIHAWDFWRMVESDIGDEPCPTEAFDDESSSEEEWSENDEGEPDMEPAAQPVPGSWIQDFDC